MLLIVRGLLPLLLLLGVVAGPLLANGDEDAMDCPALRLADLGGELFISVRHYPGLDPDDYDTINERTRDGFIPIISESPGFVLYALANVQPDQLLAVNIFQSEDEMQASNEKAADFVRENLAPLLPEAPQVTAGDVTVLALPGHCDEDMQDEDGEAMADDDGDEDDEEAMADMQPLFLSFRHYTGFDQADVPAIAGLVAADFVQVISDSEGFRLYLNLNVADEVYGAINVFTSEEEMTASNEKAADFVAEALAELLPEAPTITNGDVAIFHVGELEAALAMDAEEAANE